MGAEAANAFLKILEEPPPGLVFLLTTQALSSLLPTLISRTRILRFRSLSHKDLLSLLEGVSDDDRKFILRIAQGAPGIVRTFRDNPELLRAHRQIHAKALSFWQTTSLRERLQLLTPLQKRGEESDLFLLHLALTLRDQTLTRELSGAFHELTRGLMTNAHRGLLLQRFSLAIQGKYS
jgi:DNA polymerase-3 subunit delta'